MEITATVRRCRAPLMMLALSVALGGSRAAADPLYTITDLGPDDSAWDQSPSADSSSLSITDDGQVFHGRRLTAGDYQVWTGQQGSPGATAPLAFFQKAGDAPITLQPVAGDASAAYGVNTSGHVVGWGIGMSGHGEGFFYTPEQGFVTLKGLQSTSEFALLGINDSDQIVGNSLAPGGGTHAFLTTPGGAAVDLNDQIPTSSGWTLLSATGINDRGQIVGYGEDPSGAIHGFELTPTAVPEPSVLALFGLAGATYGLRITARRHRHAG